MKYPTAAAFLFLLAGVSIASAQNAPSPQSYFAIHVVDDATGRGVPLVQLATVNNISYWTDSNGYVAFFEPGLMDRKVFFYVSSHGYEFPADGFGYRGKAIQITPGGSAEVRIKRINIAERLYRITGQGIYRDTVLLGKPAPIREPVLNGCVFGQDSVQSAVYRDRIFWAWGDTNRPAYPLGQFWMSGATSQLPGKGGLDPSVGVDLTYFVGDDGFSRPMFPRENGNLKWAEGFMILKDEHGVERLIARCDIRKNLETVLGRELSVFNDATGQFQTLKTLDMDSPVYPWTNPERVTVDGVEYYYFGNPFPQVRVKADMQSAQDLSRYESFTCLVPGKIVKKQPPALDRDAGGKLVWAWKKNAAPPDFQRQMGLIASGKMKPEESFCCPRDVETGKPVCLQSGSACFNPFRNRWILIAVQGGGKSSFLGEVWYSEADSPQGPWLLARKVITHNRYTFYNPRHHPFFDQQGGRIIYFEGTYCTTFSGNDVATPRYDYNQIMYRLDLADPRLSLSAAGR